jgi:hypothetical protein
MDMGLSPAQANKLTAAGKALTKDDLVQLWSNKLTANAAKATLGDIEIIKQGFSPVAAATTAGEAGDVNCCCCPCCCATAVIKPLRPVA